jgi:UDP-glucose 4-epimerase
MKTASRRKIMITGASGFLGSHLRARLLGEGAELHGVSRVKRQLPGEAVRWWQGDMADIGCARRLFQEIDPDTVYHLSGLATASPERDLVLPTPSGRAAPMRGCSTDCMLSRWSWFDLS